MYLQVGRQSQHQAPTRSLLTVHHDERYQIKIAFEPLEAAAACFAPNAAWLCVTLTASILGTHAAALGLSI